MNSASPAPKRIPTFPQADPFRSSASNKALARRACISVLEDAKSSPSHKLQAAKILAGLDKNLQLKPSRKRKNASESVDILTQLRAS